LKEFANSLFIILLLSTMASIAAPIYTWQDDQGRVYYSDRPVDDAVQLRRTDLNTQIPAANADQQAPSDNPYSIRSQIEYFDQRKEAQRQAWLDEQKLRQSAKVQELQTQQLQQQAEQQDSYPETVYTGYYRPYYGYRPHRPHRPHRRGVKVNSPYAQQLLLQSGYPNATPGRPYPSTPLNFWKH